MGIRTPVAGSEGRQDIPAGRPLGTPSVYLGPERMAENDPAKHTRTGYTPWYCLQDIERCPPVTYWWPPRISTTTPIA